MKKRIDHILNIFIGSLCGVWLGRSLYLVWDHTARPGLYAMQSAPWYTGIMVNGLFTAVLLVALLIIKWVLRKWMK